MTVSTFTQPDRTTQSGSAYPANIDGAISVLARSAAAFAPHEQSTPNMTVRVDAGFLLTDFNLSTVAAQNTGTITAPTTNPRIDRVVLDPKTGVVSVLTGVQASSPVPLSIPDDKYPICQIALTTSTTAITNSMITDERPGVGALYAIDHNRTSQYRSALSNYTQLAPAVSKNVSLTSIVQKAVNLQVVAVGVADGTDAYILYGTNTLGMSLTEASNPKNFNLHDVALSSSTYVAVGNADGTDAYVVTSTNGSAWTERANPKNFTLLSVDANVNTVVAVGQNDGTDAYVIRSTDNGSTWAEIANSDLYLKRVKYFANHSVWLACGHTDDANVDSAILRSTDDGASFSLVGSVPDITSLGYLAELPSNGDILAFLDGSIDNRMLRSTDGGATWSTEYLPLSKAVYHVITLDRGILLLSDYYNLYTEDGYAFYPMPHGSSLQPGGGLFTDNTSTNHVLIVGAATGTNPLILKSNSIPPAAL